MVQGYTPHIVGMAGSGILTENISYYNPISGYRGGFGSSGGARTTFETRVTRAGKFKYFRYYLEASGCDPGDKIEVDFLKNGTSVCELDTTGDYSGAVEDTTTEVSVSVGDTVCWSIKGVSTGKYTTHIVSVMQSVFIDTTSHTLMYGLSTLTDGNSISAGAKNYFGLDGVGAISATNAKVKHYGGTIKELSCYCLTNTLSNNGKIRVFKNDVEQTDLTLTLVSGSTRYTATADVSVAEGDTLYVEVEGVAGTGSMVYGSITLTITDGTAITFVARHFNSYSYVYYNHLHGDVGSPSRARAEVKFYAYGGTLSKLYLLPFTNTENTTSETKKSMKGGVAGNLVVTVPASSTSAVEDTTNTDTVSANELWCYEASQTSGAIKVIVGIGSIKYVPTGEPASPSTGGPFGSVVPSMMALLLSN